MRHRLLALITVAFAWIVEAAVAAPVPPDGLPAGTTAVCNDGSYSASLDKRGACRGHRGVKDWYGPSTGAAVRAGDASSTPRSSTPGEAMDTPGVSAPGSAGSDKVWINENTKVYHCPGDKHYGKTERGLYLSEADAKRKGYHANQGKGCA